MNLSMSVNGLILFQIALFAIFSPFAVIGPYSILTEGYTRGTKTKVALRVSLYSTMVLILVAWGGEFILKILGISIGSLKAAGGLVLILSSLPMIMNGEAPRKKVKNLGYEESRGEPVPHDIETDWESIVISPLVFPLTIGAGSISLVITQVGRVAGLVDRFAITACLVFHGLVIFATYLLSASVAGRLKDKGTAVITRVGGIILMCLAFEIFTSGLLLLLPGLG